MIVGFKLLELDIELNQIDWVIDKKDPEITVTEGVKERLRVDWAPVTIEELPQLQAVIEEAV